MEIYERLQYLRKKILKLTQEEFGKSLGLSRGNIANIEVGRIKLTERNLQDICNTYNINKDWLLTGDGGNENIFIKFSRFEQTYHKFECIMKYSTTEKKAALSLLLDVIYSMPDDKWNLIMNQYYGYIKEIEEEDREAEYKNANIKYFDYYNSLNLSDTPSKMVLSVSQLTQQEFESDFIVTVVGHGMEGLFNAKDKVFVKKESSLKTGNIGLFFIDGCYQLKIYGDHQLLSSNPAYNKNSFDNFKKAIYIGKVVGVIGKKLPEYEAINIAVEAAIKENQKHAVPIAAYGGGESIIKEALEQIKTDDYTTDLQEFKDQKDNKND